MLAECAFPWSYGRTYHMDLEVDADRIRAGIDGTTLFDLHDSAYDSGGVALSVTEGRSATHAVHITALHRHDPPEELT